MRNTPGLMFLVLMLIIGVMLGAGLTPPRISQASQAREQDAKSDANRIFVNGRGVADSSKRPPEHWERFTLIASNDQRSSFKVVPAGKSFIVTDILYNVRLVRQHLTVNFARVTPDDKTDTLFQIYLTPGQQHETHLCTGYAIPSGYGIGAWTNAGLEPEQFVHIAVTGYLIDAGQP
jgi:hypothetical protein